MHGLDFNQAASYPILDGLSLQRRSKFDPHVLAGIRKHGRRDTNARNPSEPLPQISLPNATSTAIRFSRKTPALAFGGERVPETRLAGKFKIPSKGENR